MQHRIIHAITRTVVAGNNADFSIGRVDISWFRNFIFEEVYLSDEAKDSMLYVEKLTVRIDSLSFLKRRLHLGEIKALHPDVRIDRIDSARYNFSFLFDEKPDSLAPLKWRLSSERINIRSGTIAYSDSCGKVDVLKNVMFHKFDLLADQISLGPGSDFFVRIKKIAFLNGNDFELKRFGAKLSYVGTTLSVNELFGLTRHSRIDLPHLEVDFTGVEMGGIGMMGLGIELKAFEFGLADMAWCLPDFNNSELKLEASGDFYGTVGDLRAKNINLFVHQLGSLKGDISLTGLPDIDQTFIFANLSESYVDASALKTIQLPANLKKYVEKIYPFVFNLGQFQYQGNFTGFINDFVAYGTFYSNLGMVNGDLSFKPGEGGATWIDGHVASKKLKIGTIFQNKLLGKLDANGNIKGWFVSGKNYDLKFNGFVGQIDFNNYQYSNINLDGLLKHNHFEGQFGIDDPNLLMNFSGDINFADNHSVFNFSSVVTKANMVALNIIDDSISNASFILKANFTGKNIDDFIGNVFVENLFYKNAKDSLTMNYAEIKTSGLDELRSLEFNSDWFNAKLDGAYQLTNLYSSLVQFYDYYLPSSIVLKKMPENDKNNFLFEAHIKDIKSVLNVFYPDWHVNGPIDIYGKYNPGKKDLWIESLVPSFGFKNYLFDSLYIRVDSDEEKILAKIESDKVHLLGGLELFNFGINLSAENDRLNTFLKWKNQENGEFGGELMASAQFTMSENQKSRAEIHLIPTEIFLNDLSWQISDAVVVIDSSSFYVDGLEISHNAQKFLIDGAIAKDDDAVANLKIYNVDMKLFDKFLRQSMFSGTINGNATLSNFYGMKRMNVDLHVDDLKNKNGTLGELIFISDWSDQYEKLKTEMYLVNNDSIVFSANGFIDVDKKAADIDLVFDRASVSILEVLMPKTFNKQGGLAEGSINIKGPLNDLKYNGTLYPVGPVSLGLTYLNTVYRTTDPVIFSNDSILFPSMKIWDEHDNSGIFSGHIKHRNFAKMVYNLQVVADKVMIFNTTSSQNEYFYGTAFITGNASITGRGEDVFLTGFARTSRGTQINIPFETPQNAVAHSFIQFGGKSDSLVVPNSYKVKTQGINIDFDLEVTPDAKAQLIINSQNGDIIRGEGNGNLKLRVDKNYRINLYGDYVIQNGDYIFTLQNVFSKKFTIDRGGTLSWSGNPYNAKIDLVATHRLNASLYDLFLGSYDDFDVYRRLPVNAVIKLTDELIQPNIRMSVDLPTADERVKDALRQVIVTEEDNNRQIISLLLFGRFYTPEYIAGTPSNVSGTQMVQSALGSTVSDLFSSQISNWVSQIVDNWDVGVNYRPGNELANDQWELALATQFFNDRVLVNSNFANDANPSSTNQGSIVNDVDVLIKLTNNGKLQFKAYNHSNDPIIRETGAYTQGLGFTYREEFSSFSELLSYYREAIFGRKKKRAVPN